MKLRKRLRRIPEALLVLLASYSIPFLSRRAICSLSRLLGRCFYKFDGRHRRIGLANLNIAFGDSISPERKHDILRAMFRSQALTLLDLLWFRRKTKARLRNWVVCDASFDMVFDVPSAVLVTAHLSNWEVISLTCGLRGGRFTSIYMEQKNRFVTKLLNDLRTKTGSKIVKREGGLRALLKSMKEGRGTGLLLDQNTLPYEGGVFVPFFGVPAPVSNISGVFVERVNAKLYMVWCTADDQGRYQLFAKDPYPDGMPMGADRKDITAHLTLELESIIRQNPDFWTWGYKRWRFCREEDDKSLFPFYVESYESYIRYIQLVQNYQKAKAALDAVNEEERLKRIQRKKERRRKKRGDESQ